MVDDVGPKPMPSAPSTSDATNPASATTTKLTHIVTPRMMPIDPQRRHDGLGGVLGRGGVGVDVHLGRLGRLVGRVDAGEVGELAAPRLGVEALDVARLGDLERRVDEHLDELALADAARGPSARSARNGEMNDDEHDQAGVDHQLGDLGDAADVLDPVGVGEAEVLVEPVADVVAVEQVGVARRAACSLLLDQVGDGRLAGAGQAGEPHARPGCWPLSAARASRVDVERLPVDVLGPAQREVEQPGADGGVGQPVDEDEAAHVAVLGVGVERDRPVDGRRCRRRSR